MTEIDYYESVRQKMSIDGLGTPKHKRTIEFLKRMYSDEEIKLIDHFDRAYQLLSPKQLAQKASLEKADVKKIERLIHKSLPILDLPKTIAQREEMLRANESALVGQEKQNGHKNEKKRFIKT